MNPDIDSPESTESQLTRGGLMTFGVKVASVILGFALQLLIARLLGQSGYGDYTFAVATLNFLVVAALAGGDSAATRFVANYHTCPSLLSQFLQWLNVRAIILSIGCLGLALLLLQWIKLVDERPVWGLVQIISLALPFQVFALIRQGILRGRHRPVLSVIPEGLVRPIVTLMLLWWVISFFSQGSLSPRDAAVIFVFVSLVALMVGQVLMKQGLAQVDKTQNTEQRGNPKQWQSMALASMLTATAMTLHAQCDIWMLGLYTNGQTVGPYAAATKYATLVIFGLNAVNTAAGPMVARSTDPRQQHDQLQKIAQRIVWISFLLGGGVAALLLIFPEAFLGLFGEGFQRASLALRILVAGNLFNIACGSVGMLLSMSGYHVVLMRILLASTLLNVTLNLLLIPWFQTTGAAIATGLSILFWNSVALVFVRRLLKIRPTLGGLV
ncbi:MAG: oligosaccharide flippase family protein [Planctomycetota bacterium]|nr:oligosaccharide flippase family protein [Planctomycetota bacterium]